MDPKPLDLSTYSSETIEIEIAGKTYRGIRFITGIDELRQEVHFWDLRQIDPRPHRPRDVSQMRSIARVILRDLVAQSNAEEARRPVRVEPDAKPRRARDGPDARLRLLRTPSCARLLVEELEAEWRARRGFGGAMSG